MQCFFMQVFLQFAGFCRFLQVSCKFLEFRKLNLQKTLHGNNLHFDITTGLQDGMSRVGQELCFPWITVWFENRKQENLVGDTFKGLA